MNTYKSFEGTFVPRNGVSTPPEGFCIGVMAFLSSVEEVPSSVNELQESLRSSWAPGANLRLLVLLPSSATPEHLSNPSLASIYLASVLYLVGRDNSVSLHRVHPFTGAVLQINPANTDLFPSPLQVKPFNWKRVKPLNAEPELNLGCIGWDCHCSHPCLLTLHVVHKGEGWAHPT